MWYKILQFYVKRTIINIVTYIIKPRYWLLKIAGGQKDEGENIILSDCN